MEVKTFEIRDGDTHIPILCIELFPRNMRDKYILERAGYSVMYYILMIEIAGESGKATCNPYDWGEARTLQVSHQHIIDNWSKLENGAVIDVEFILGITTSPKQSEQIR